VATRVTAQLDGAPANTRSPRERRYERRALLWEVSDLERVSKCGRVPTSETGRIGLRLRADGVAGLAGLQSCGSVWADPICNAKIMARRALEIGAAIALWQSQGHPVAFATFTMRHHRNQGLQALWDGLQAAWARVTSGRAWVAEKGAYGVAGWLRVVEVTRGRNGWHVHIHAVLFLREWPTSAQLASWHRGMIQRWTAGLVRNGLAAPLMLGQDLRLIEGPADTVLADYFTKATDRGSYELGLELTQTQSKQARTKHGTWPVWALLDGVQDGDADDLDAWHEWERVSKGRRQLTWAQGLRQLLALGVEHSDEDIAGEEVGTAADELLLIEREGWAILVARPRLIAQLLDAVEAGGLVGAREFLDRLGCAYTLRDQS
jgi:hypothetical protein